MRATRRLKCSVLCTFKEIFLETVSGCHHSPAWHHPWRIHHAARQTGLHPAQCRAASTNATGTSGAATVLVVESPAKARKIQGFLGGSYKVSRWLLDAPCCAVALRDAPSSTTQLVLRDRLWRATGMCGICRASQALCSRTKALP